MKHLYMLVVSSKTVDYEFPRYFDDEKKLLKYVSDPNIVDFKIYDMEQIKNERRIRA